MRPSKKCWRKWPKSRYAGYRCSMVPGIWSAWCLWVISARPRRNGLAMRCARSRTEMRGAGACRARPRVDSVIPRNLVVLVRARGVRGGAIVARQLFERIGGRRLQLFLGERHDIAVFALDIVERRPRNGMVLLVHAEKSAEADHGIDDVVRRLVEDDVFDLTDFLARRVLDGGTEDLLGTNCRGVAGCGCHCDLLCFPFCDASPCYERHGQRLHRRNTRAPVSRTACGGAHPVN